MSQSNSASGSRDSLRVRINAPFSNKEILQSISPLHSEKNLKSGYLKKKGNSRKSWKKRWFVLRPTKLCYYNDEKEYELLTIINLNEIHTIAMVNYNSHREFVFALVSPNRTFYMQAETKESLVDWVATIKAVKKDGFDMANGTVSMDPKNLKRLISIQLSEMEATDDTSQISNPSTIESQLTVLSNTPSNSNLNNNRRGSHPLSQSSINRVSSPESSSADSDSSEHLVDDEEDEEEEEEEERLPNVGVMTHRGDLLVSSNSLNLERELTDNGVFYEDKILLQGYMKKRSKNFKNWKTFWFVLRNKTIYMYKNEKEYILLKIIKLNFASSQNLTNDKKLNKKLIIDIINCNSKPEDSNKKQRDLSSDNKTTNNHHCFKIVFLKKEMLFSCETEKMRDDWVTKLKEILEESKTIGSNSMGSRFNSNGNLINNTGRSGSHHYIVDRSDEGWIEVT
ncbi:hypothetical protein HK099_002282 [Clydaea vesicula]|uniref:PH domain-containing protein n=1 Tax=Clydaea vesicula TaxID=447962 RepID=A0AAD5Y1G8_9FUNG|nr:hypothetical protein HK099_002282 [Clydaea vesicula]